MGTRRVRIEGLDGSTEYTMFFRKVSPFSNHHPVEFECQDAINCQECYTFSCNEQFYMFNKASLFGDKEIMAEVLKSNDPKQMKRICGNGNIKGWSDKIWNEHKDDVMKKGVMAKFRSAQHLRFVLFLSRGSQLLECSQFDKYWGIGKDIQCAEQSLRYGIDGENKLGKILDEVREILWNDPNYSDEICYITRKIVENPSYSIDAIKKLDMIYKDRAAERYAIICRKSHKSLHSATDDQGIELIPEWGRPPPIEQNMAICPSPPVICDFERSSTMTTPSSNYRSCPPNRHRGRFERVSRLTHSVGDFERRKRRRTSSSSDEYPRSRDWKRRRLSRRSKSRSRSTSRNRTDRRKRSTSRKRKTSRERHHSRSRSREYEKRDKKDKRRRSRSRSRKDDDRKKSKKHKKEKKHKKDRKRDREHSVTDSEGSHMDRKERRAEKRKRKQEREQELTNIDEKNVSDLVTNDSNISYSLSDIPIPSPPRVDVSNEMGPSNLQSNHIPDDDDSHKHNLTEMSGEVFSG